MQNNGVSIGFRRVGVMAADSPERCQWLTEKEQKLLLAPALELRRLQRDGEVLGIAVVAGREGREPEQRQAMSLCQSAQRADRKCRSQLADPDISIVVEI